MDVIDERELVERAVRALVREEPSFDDLIKRRHRKRRNQRIAAGVVGIAVFVAAIWIVTSGGVFDRTQTPAVPGPAETGPTETGELILSVYLYGDASAREELTHMYVYAGGRLIWSRDGALPDGANDFYTGLVEQRLTPEGVELMRSEVISSGLIDPDSYMVDGQADPDLFPFFGTITVRDAGQLVGREFAHEHSQPGGPPFPIQGETVCYPEGDCAHFATAEEESALERLYGRLTDPASWLPASAWADQEIRTYVPSRYQVCYGGYRKTIERDRVLNALPGPVAELLRARDAQPHGIGGLLASIKGHAPTGYCSDLTTEKTRVLVRALDDAGLERKQPGWAAFRYDFPVPFSGQGPDPIDTSARILIDPYLPHGEVICIPCG
jgi:hypothetical protein